MGLKHISNEEIAKILDGVGEYLAMQNVEWRPRAYRNAASSIRALEDELGDIYKEGGVKALKQLPAIGQTMAEHIEELLETGKLKEYEKLKDKTPVEVEDMVSVEGIGPKTVKTLYKELGVRTIDEMEKVAKKGKIRELEGFGKKSEENILKSIEFHKRASGRMTLGKAIPIAKRLKEYLSDVKGVDRVTLAGSIRRRKETIGDIDILVVASNPSLVMEKFVNMSNVSRVLAHGETKSSVTLREGLDADIRIVPEKSYGAALHYFTGSKEHNVALRQIAIKKGYKLNEYGLWKPPSPEKKNSSKKGKMIAGKTEEDIYKKLGLSYIEPELREMKGEIEVASTAKGAKLPKLIGYDDLRGDLQVQTSWTDGSASIEKMAIEAAERGLEYIVITDHTKRLAMTGGLDEEKLMAQIAEIDKINKKLKGKIRILKGSECDILKDGSLDLSDEALSKLDVVGVSVHSYFNLSREAQTERVIKAMENPNADILFHPTGRLIGKRPPIDIDMEKIIQVAKRTGTIMEIDAYPDRLDLKDDHIRMCVNFGVKMAINSDAHDPKHFEVLEYGIAQARRGWAEKSDIINAWPADKMLSFLKGKQGTKKVR